MHFINVADGREQGNVMQNMFFHNAVKFLAFSEDLFSDYLR